MSCDVGGEQVDVVEQHRLKGGVLRHAEVVPGDLCLDERVEVGGGVAEQTLVAEHGRHVGGQRVRVDGTRTAEPVDDAAQGGDGSAEKLASDLAGTVAGAQDVVDLPVNASAELGRLVPRPGPQPLADGRDPGVAHRPDQVSPGFELAAANLDVVDAEGYTGPGEHLLRLGGGQVCKQGPGEQAHERDVLGGVVGGHVPVQVETRFRCLGLAIDAVREFTCERIVGSCCTLNRARGRLPRTCLVAAARHAASLWPRPVRHGVNSALTAG